MTKFNLEEYRHPWETGPHWELKKEFMEKYSDMFTEDRLLCLAQAYSNIVLMHCSYPEPVMRQISLLSKPLEMRKKFQESNISGTTEPSSEEQKGKRKYAHEDSGKSCKLTKFCASKEQLISTDSCNSTVLHENVLKQPSQNSNICASIIGEQSISTDSSNSTVLYENVLKQPSQSSNHCVSNNLTNALQQFQSNSNVTDKDQHKFSVVNSNAQCEDNVQYNEIIATLGLEFIQNFLQEVRKFQTKVLSASESIMSAAQKLKICRQICFKIDNVPNCPPHAPLFCSEFRINGCLISSEHGSSKKKAKAKCAETALDILIKICSENRIESNAKKVVIDNQGLPTNGSFINKSVNEQCMDIDSLHFKPVVDITQKSTNSDAVISDMEVLQTFSDIIAKCKSESVVEIKRIAKSLNLHDYILLNTSEYSNSLQESKYMCKLFLKNILISSEENASKEEARILAAKSCFQKLKNLSQYEIVNGELKRRQNINTNKPSKAASSGSIMAGNYDFQSSSFTLNQTMFDRSIRDGFVLVDNLSHQCVTKKSARAILSASASFCRKPFEYKFEEISGTNPPSIKVSLVIGGGVVATAIASARDQAKIIACDIALDILKKKYYTLKIKNEYSDGYIISHSQVFDGESFSCNALTEKNIGCKMLKNMGWTGGGLGTSGITEPVEAQGHNSFGRGLGYGREESDLLLFKRKINTMMQEYSKTSTLSDLIFSKEFTKEERKEIHKIALNYGLHSASHGSNKNRFLTVKHKYTVHQVLLYLQKNGGSNSKFELVDSIN